MDQSTQTEIDFDLMQRVSLDDEDAIAELYDRFGPLVYRMAYQTMPSRADADDVVQEVFVRLWRTAARYDPKRAALVTWVMLIARRHMVDRLRRARARLKPTTLEEGWSPPAESEDPEAAAAQSERFAAMLEKVEKLPELQRTVIKRAYLGGQTLKQIGIELNVPLGTIKSALSRALVKLRERSVGEEQAA